MQLITGVKIKDFRSARQLSLGKLSDVNVFSGRNDAGKSTIIKALNLFFNGQTDWKRSLDFYQDFNIDRRLAIQEKTHSRQVIEVAVAFRRPPSYPSLPESFTITKKWFRNGDVKVADTIPDNATNARRSLSRLLGNLKYVYIPAIKDEAVFSETLSTLRASLYAQMQRRSSDIDEALRVTNKRVNEVAGSLSEDFRKATNIRTQIQLPATLDRILDVSIATKHLNTAEDVSLQLRGDGIRARYLPSILYYLARSHPGTLYIWGFEEPEDSLEYRLSTLMAQDFKETYSSEVQMFLTTHSPAFVGLMGQEKVNVYRVVNESGNTRCFQLTGQAPPSINGAPDLALQEDLGLTLLATELHRTYEAQLNAYRKASALAEKIADRLHAITTPIVLTEGTTDTSILRTAYSRLYPNAGEFAFEACDPLPKGAGGGAGGAFTLKSYLETVRPKNPSIVIGLFDNDQEGQKQFSRLSNFTPMDFSESVKRHINGRAFAVLLPVPPHRADWERVANLCIEWYFSDNAIQRRTALDRGLRLRPMRVTISVEGRTSETVEATDPFQQVIDEGKVAFANEIVPTLDDEEFAVFRNLFEIFRRCLNDEAEEAGTEQVGA